MIKDPVCGMDIQQNKAAAHVDYKGKIYYFCSVSCRDKFNASPQAYVQKEQGGHSHGKHGGCC